MSHMQFYHNICPCLMGSTPVNQMCQQSQEENTLRIIHMYKINNLSFYHRKLEKEEQYKPKESRGEEIIKIKAEISEIANRNN